MQATKLEAQTTHEDLFPPKPAAAEANNPTPSISDVLIALAIYAPIDKGDPKRTPAENAALGAGLLEYVPLTPAQKSRVTKGKYTRRYIRITTEGYTYLGYYRKVQRETVTNDENTKTIKPKPICTALTVRPCMSLMIIPQQAREIERQLIHEFMYREYFQAGQDQRGGLF